jgi:hypothetical protein
VAWGAGEGKGQRTARRRWRNAAPWWREWTEDSGVWTVGDASGGAKRDSPKVS